VVVVVVAVAEVVVVVVTYLLTYGAEPFLRSCQVVVVVAVNTK
jgi:hypothetical protein